MAVMVRRGWRRSELFSSLPPGTILDFPAGEGEESRRLAGLGYRPVMADLFIPACGPDGFAYVQADANRMFPFRDQSFDYVLSREGIEHLEYQAGFLRECARVLKPGGRLVLTTPNLLHLNSRLSYLLTGQRILRRGLVNEIQTLRTIKDGNPYHGHAFLIDYFRLRYLLRLNGFGRLQVFTDRLSPSSIAMAWLVPFLMAASWLSIRMSVRKDRGHGKALAYGMVFREIGRHVFSSALLFGKKMIVVAERERSELPIGSSGRERQGLSDDSRA